MATVAMLEKSSTSSSSEFEDEVDMVAGGSASRGASSSSRGAIDKNES